MSNKLQFKLIIENIGCFDYKEFNNFNDIFNNIDTGKTILFKTFKTLFQNKEIDYLKSINKDYGSIKCEYIINNTVLTKEVSIDFENKFKFKENKEWSNYFKDFNFEFYDKFDNDLFYILKDEIGNIDRNIFFKSVENKFLKDFNISNVQKSYIDNYISNINKYKEILIKNKKSYKELRNENIENKKELTLYESINKDFLESTEKKLNINIEEYNNYKILFSFLNQKDIHNINEEKYNIEEYLFSFISKILNISFEELLFIKDNYTQIEIVLEGLIDNITDKKETLHIIEKFSTKEINKILLKFDNNYQQLLDCIQIFNNDINIENIDKNNLSKINLNNININDRKSNIINIFKNNSDLIETYINLFKNEDFIIDYFNLEENILNDLIKQKDNIIKEKNNLLELKDSFEIKLEIIKKIKKDEDEINKIFIELNKEVRNLNLDNEKYLSFITEENINNIEEQIQQRILELESVPNIYEKNKIEINDKIEKIDNILNYSFDNNSFIYSFNKNLDIVKKDDNKKYPFEILNKSEQINIIMIMFTYLKSLNNFFENKKSILFFDDFTNKII